MLAIEFQGSRQIGKPKNMTDEECGGLEILQGTVQEEGDLPAYIHVGVTTPETWPFTLSCWKPSKEDLEALNAGRPIWVRVLSHVVHPLSLFTTDEQGEVNQ